MKLHAILFLALSGSFSLSAMQESLDTSHVMAPLSITMHTAHLEYAKLAKQLMDQPITPNGKKILKTQYEDARIVELFNNEAQRIGYRYLKLCSYQKNPRQKHQIASYYPLTLNSDSPYIAEHMLRAIYLLIIKGLNKGWIFKEEKPFSETSGIWCHFTKTTFAEGKDVLIKFFAHKLGLFPHKVVCNKEFYNSSDSIRMPKENKYFLAIRSDSYEEVDRILFNNNLMHRYKYT